MQLFCTKMGCQHIKVNSTILAQYEELTQQVANQYRFMLTHEHITRLWM